MQAAAGASGIVLLINRNSVEAGALAACLQAAVAAAANAMPLPLLVLVADPSGSSSAVNGTHTAFGDALAQELHHSSGSGSTGERVSAVEVVDISAPRCGGEAGPSEAALLQGLAWLAEHAPPQPRLWVSTPFVTQILADMSHICHISL